MKDYLVKKQAWRIWVIIAIIIMAAITVNRYETVIWTEPVTGIDTSIVNRGICYHIFKGMNDYVDINTIYGNGLLDIDTGKNELKIAFAKSDKIKSIHGYCKVTGGYVNFDTNVIEYSGGGKDFWEDRIIKNYIEENEKYATIKTSAISIPLTRNDLHKTITFDVKFDAVYPKRSANKNQYFDTQESIYQQYEIYIISQDEMKVMKKYTLWKHRGYHITLFLVMAALTSLLIGFVILYRRKELMYILKN